MYSANADKIYTVTLVNESKGLNATIQVCGDEYILDAAEDQNVQLPYSCRAGSCFACTGKLIEGEVDQSEHCFLKIEEVKAGFLLTCKTYPTSDCLIQTHQEEELLEL